MADPAAAVGSVLDVREEVLGFVGSYAWWVAAAATFAAALWAAATGWWWRRAAAALEDRVVLQLVPASTFEAGAAEVRWFAGQLASVPAASGAPPRRASAARVRITCEDDRVRYWLEGPGRAQSLLRMPGYHGVEVVENRAGSRIKRIRFDGVAPVKGARS
jgi:hypothetical protein